MGEPRWIRQTDNFRCGPIAIANVLKWAGLPCSWKKDRDRLSALCSVDNKMGTDDVVFERALRESLGKTAVVERHTKFKIQDVVELVGARGVVIFDFTWGGDNMRRVERDGHYTVCVESLGEGDYFKFINFQKGETITWVEREWYKRVFSRRCVGDNAWFIELTSRGV